MHQAHVAAHVQLDRNWRRRNGHMISHMDFGDAFAPLPIFNGFGQQPRMNGRCRWYGSSPLPVGATSSFLPRMRVCSERGRKAKSRCIEFSRSPLRRDVRGLRFQRPPSSRRERTVRHVRNGAFVIPQCFRKHEAVGCVPRSRLERDRRPLAAARRFGWTAVGRPM